MYSHTEFTLFFFAFVGSTLFWLGSFIKLNTVIIILFARLLNEPMLFSCLLNGPMLYFCLPNDLQTCVSCTRVY